MKDGDTMLTQSEADLLIALEKIFLQTPSIKFPIPGKNTRYPIESTDSHEKFTLAIVRGGKNRLKCSYTELNKANVILLRVDTEQGVHINPDGVDVPAPHLHIYREGYNDRFAYPLPDSFINSKDLVQTFYDFLNYSNVINTNDIHISIQGGLFDDTGEVSKRLEK